MYYSDSEYLTTILDTLLSPHNWKKYDPNNTNDKLTLLLTESYNTSLIDSLTPKITNFMAIEPKNNIMNKKILYNLFQSYNPEICNKYMFPQYDTSIKLSPTLFINDLYTLESEDKTIPKIIINKYKKYSKNIAPNMILSKYLITPLLYKNRVFYIKTYFMIFYDRVRKEYKAYVMEKMYIMICKDFFVLGDFDNPNIIHPLGPETYGEFKILTYVLNNHVLNVLQKRIYKLVYYLLNIINTTCYKPKTNCYMVFEMDLQPTNNLDIILQRINNATYYRGGICDDFNKYLIECQIAILFDIGKEIKGYIEITSAKYLKDKFKEIKKEYIKSK